MDSRDINTFEIWAASSLAGTDVPRVSVASRTLASVLRPKGFNGGLVNSVGVVVPTDLEWINRVTTQPSESRLTPGRVLSVVVGADMLSGVQVKGHVALGATYFRRSPNARNGLVGRRLGSTEKVKEGAEIATALKAESAQRARLFAAIALQSPYSGGLPGLGSRR